MTNATLQWTLDSPGWLPVSDSTDAAEVVNWVDACVDHLQGTWQWTPTDDELASLRAELLAAYADRMEAGTDAEFVVWPLRTVPPTKVRLTGIDREQFSLPRIDDAKGALFETEGLGSGIELNRMLPAGDDGYPQMATLFVFEAESDVLLVTMDPVPPMARQLFHGDLVSLLASIRIETAPGIPFAATRRDWMTEAAGAEHWETGEGE